jgi:hypothetical protein
MMNILKVGFVALALGITSAFGAVSDADRSLVERGRNILFNPGFESGTSGVTATPAAVANSTAKAYGALGLSWNSTAAAQTLTLKTVAIPDGLKGKSAVLACKFKAASGSPTHLFQVDDGTGPNPIQSNAITTSTSSFIINALSFIAPASGNLRPIVKSVAADEPEIYIDECVLTEAEGYNLFTNRPEAVHLGTLTYSPAASCSWSATSASYVGFAADTDCSAAAVTGSVGAPATKIPAFTLSSLPPGRLFAIASGSLLKASATSYYCSYRLNDGTTSSLQEPTIYDGGSNPSLGTTQFSIDYPNGISSLKTFEIQNKGNGSNACLISANQTEGESLNFDVYYYPTQSQTAVTLNTVSGSWTGYHANNCTWSRSGTTYGDYTGDASCTFTERDNSNFGTVTSFLDGSDKAPGIVFTPFKTGRFWVCAIPQTSKGASNEIAEFRLLDTEGSPTVIANTEQVSTGGAAFTLTLPLCGIYKIDSLSQRTLKIQGAAGSSTSDIGASSVATNSRSSIEWSIFPIDQNLPAPVLVGSVTTSSSSAEYSQHAKVTNNGSSCVVSESSGNWISSTNRTGAGTCSLNLTGFTAAPTCTTAIDDQANAMAARIIQSTKTSTFVAVKTVNNSDTATDYNFEIICKGSK